MNITKDVPNRTITITRHFDAAPELVWKAWTQRELLDQWWAPKPYTAETKFLDFSEGGYWLYAMVAPDQSKRWSRFDYARIDAPHSFEVVTAFCDEQGVVTDQMPGTQWKNSFRADATGTEVVVELSFATESQLVQLVELGFEVGFTAALTNLDDYLSVHSVNSSN